ncbi:MAG: asparagine synthase (glutamine-hydrolyzing) [Bacteroidia bacterium]
MCGIAGFAGHNSIDLLKKMNDALTHRGPDAEGFYTDEAAHVSIANRRLSIIDIEHGQQPMSNENESHYIVFNGEIFNAPELRKDLELKNYSFRTQNSDTEVLLKLYACYGKEMTKMLNGMFAFVIYDKNKKKLFGARDPFGIKPFFYSSLNGYFYFASEIKSLLKIPELNSKQINMQAVYDFLSFQCIPAPHTIYEKINKLPAAYQFTYHIEKKELKIERYWELQFHKKPIKLSYNETTELLRNKLELAVNRWSLSDVPLAFSLSGGVDSAALVGIMAQKSNKKIRTYSMGFYDSPEFDETSIARKISEKWDTDHVEFRINEKDLEQDLSAIISSLDEPLASGLAPWFVFKEMGKNVKVAHTGTGGDELFGNYRKWAYRNYWKTKLNTTQEYLPRVGLLNLLKYPNAVFHYPYFTDKEKNEKLLKPSSNNYRKSVDYIESLWKVCASSNVKDKVAFIDFHLQLPEEFLMMTDRFSMAHSIEARTPYLDKELVETVFNIQPNWRSDNFDPKRLLKESVKDLLPDEVYHVKKKSFVLPVNKWLNKYFAEEMKRLFDPEKLKLQGIFKEDIYAKIILPGLKKDGISWEAYTLMMFQNWHEKSILKN